MLGSANYITQKKSPASGRPALVNRAALCRASDAGAKPGIGRPGQPSNHVDNARPDVRIQIGQKCPLLVDQIVGDALAQVAASAGCTERGRATVAGIGVLFDVPLLDQGPHDSTGGALVQKQSRGQIVEAHRPVPDEHFQRVALGHRDVVAADPVAVAKLVDAHQIGDSGLERLRIALKGGWRW